MLEQDSPDLASILVANSPRDSSAENSQSDL